MYDSTASQRWFIQLLVIAAAVLFNVMVAGLAGVLVPVALDRFGADPAVASSVFVTMTTDTMGFLAFLGLATLVGVTSLGWHCI